MERVFDRFLSELEVRALANLAGPAGIDYLISDLIYRRGVMPAMGKLKAAMDNPASVDVVEVLGYGIR